MWFETTFRNLWRYKGFTFLNVFGLAIGIACAGLIFLWSEDEINWDSNHEKRDNLYIVKVDYNNGNAMFTMGSTPRLMAEAIKQEIPGIVNTCRYSDNEQNLTFRVGDQVLTASGRYTDPGIFTMFTMPFIEGNAENAFSQIHSVVLTEAAGKKFFGSEKNIVGKVIRIDNDQDYTVSGVVKNLPLNSTIQFEWLISYEVKMAALRAEKDYSEKDQWSGYGPFTYVELSPKADVDLVNQQLKNYIHGKNPDENSSSFLYSLDRLHLYNKFADGKETGEGKISQVRLLNIIAWIVLIIACINFMNLATANSQKRAKEVGVRKVLGSSRSSLIFQFMAEALMMSFFSALLALLILSIALPSFNILVGKQLSLQTNMLPHTGALFCIVVLCGLLAGLYPSFYLSSFNPIGVLKGVKQKSGSATNIRKGMVIAQFTMSVTFIISTIVIYQQIQFIKDRELGFNKENLLEIYMQHDYSSQFASIKEHLIATGAVEDAAIANHGILDGGNTDNDFEWAGKPADSKPSIAHRQVSPEFMKVCGVKILEGRAFNENVLLDQSNIIITKAFAKLISNESVIGKVIQSPRGQEEGKLKDMTIIGVADDHVYGDMYGKPGPMIFYCEPPSWGYLLYVRTKNNVPVTEAMEKIQAVIKKDNSAFPFNYRFVDDKFDDRFKSESLMSSLSTLFATLAIIISCLGLFGLAASTAERRIKEIGIRKVLGASATSIAGLLSKDFLQLVSIACLLAFPVAAWYMHDWLQQYQYRINLSAWIFVAAAFVAILIAVITISFQSIKAALQNPVKSLRTE